MYNLSDGDFIGHVQFIGHHVCYDAKLYSRQTYAEGELRIWDKNKKLNDTEKFLWDEMMCTDKEEHEAIFGDAGDFDDDEDDDFDSDDEDDF